MKRKIRLTESELTTLIKRMVEQAQEDMGMEHMEGHSMEHYEEDMGYDDEEGEELSKPEVVDIISDFFKSEVLPELAPEERSELKHMARKATPEMTEAYLNEDLKDRFKSFKEKAMIGGGLGTMVTGMITALGEFTGWSQYELTSKIHQFVEGFGAGQYSGPITVAMVFAGLALALKGYSDRANRLDTPYTKGKSGNGFNSY
jgi:hypothetical protein